MSDRARWNERHAAAAGAPRAPADWVAAQRDLLSAAAPGRALDVACGLGRHSVLLAELGFEVDAVDVSDVAVEAVAALAAARGLPIHAHRLDLAGDPLPGGPYAAIVVVDYLERSLFGTLEAALAPGGLLVYETFTRAHAGMSPRFTLEPGELLEAFAGLRVLRHHDGGPRAGLVARRE